MILGPGPTFLYDFNSPYAYLAAERVDQVIPGEVSFQPVAFAFLLRAQDRSPWSFDASERPVGMAECERRADAYGLAPLRWPPGWPVDSYTLAPLRAALVADEHGLLRAFTAAAFRRNFVDGLGLTEPGDLRAVAEAVDLDPATLAADLGTPRIKDRLTAATAAAISAGVVGVPTVVVAEQLFWGDDQLEAAATAVRGTDGQLR